MHNARWICTGWTVFGIALGGVAWAHGDLAPAHGGRMVESRGQVLELAVREKTVDLYLTDHEGRPAGVDGAAGKVLFLVHGKKVETLLKPAGENRLSGEASTEVTGFESAVIHVEKGGQSLSGRISAQRGL
ncbi:MAG: hypothetical protein H7837_13910 [Magnetococcus sp. MYC-9]